MMDFEHAESPWRLCETCDAQTHEDATDDGVCRECRAADDDLSGDIESDSYGDDPSATYVPVRPEPCYGCGADGMNLSADMFCASCIEEAERADADYSSYCGAVSPVER